MCDCLVALPSATGTDATLFAKSSDRPPAEPQDVGWYPPRIDRGAQPAQYLGALNHALLRDVPVDIAAPQEDRHAVQRAGVVARGAVGANQATAQADERAITPGVARRELGGQARAL